VYPYSASVAAKEVVQILVYGLIVEIVDEEYAVNTGGKLGQKKGQIRIFKQIGEEVPYEKLVFALTSRMTEAFEAFEESKKRRMTDV